MQRGEKTNSNENASKILFKSPKILNNAGNVKGNLNKIV
jgi:hypothetical protein